MTEHEIESGVVATPSGLVERIERRLDQSRKFGRDVDALFKQLVVSLTADAPADLGQCLVVSARAFVAASAWAQRADPPTRAIRVTGELALTLLLSSLHDLPDADAAEHAGALVDAWASATTVPRHVVSDIILDAAKPATLSAVASVLLRRSHQLKHQVAGLLDGGSAGFTGSASARECTILQARILSRRGEVDRALDLLAAEPVSDPKVPLAFASILMEHGRGADAIERLKRCLVVAPNKRPVRELLVDAFVALGDTAEASDQLVTMMHETGDVVCWELLCDLLIENEKDRLLEIRERLQTEAPALFVDVQMAQGDVESVAAASRAKTFSYQQLWRIGDFLAGHQSRTAARVYERAINLQGAVAQSKAQCGDLASRIESVIPYFEAIERPTKPARLAKELLTKNRNNVPLRRELERVFGPKFG